MTNAEILAIIGAITGGVLALTTLVGNFFMAYKTHQATLAVAVGVREVHGVVNSKNDALVVKISALEQRVSELKEDKRDLKEAALVSMNEEQGK